MPYKATIELLIDVPDFPGACDAVAETLREHLRHYAPQSCIVDWRYAGNRPEEGLVKTAPIPAGFEPEEEWPEPVEANVVAHAAVVYGNPADGFKFVGPFASMEDACIYVATDREKDNMWAVSLDVPAP